MSYCNKKAMTPMLAVVVLLIITVSVSGGAFFWLNKIQGQISQEEDLQVRTIGTDSSKVDVVASEYDVNNNKLTLFLQNLGQTTVPLASSASVPTTIWVVKDQRQSVLCSCDWSGKDNGPVCLEGCNKAIAGGEILKVVIGNVGPGTLCNIGGQASGSLLTLTIDFGGKAVATGGIVR